MVTLASGTYTLSLMAAQVARNQSPQTLDVFVDLTQVGTIDPSSAKYEKFLIPFTAGAGTHTFSFKGTSDGNSTVLIDSIAFQTASPLTELEPQRHPATIEFLEQPVSGSAGSNVGPVLVEVFDRSGRLWSGLDVSLTLIRVGRGSRGHLVRGSVVHAKTIGGVATFRRLKISAPGRYVLRVRVGRQHVDSAPFDIGPAMTL
jgi:hypothetical protein